MCLRHAPFRDHGRGHDILVNRRRALGLLAGATAAPLLAGCDEQDGFPIRLVSDETVQQLGLETWQRLRAEIPASDDGELQRTLRQTGRRLLDAAGQDPARWEMVVFATPEVNVSTVEDPVEYEIPGINQTQVNP